jgi:hypothetical protein
MQTQSSCPKFSVKGKGGRKRLCQLQLYFLCDIQYMLKHLTSPVSFLPLRVRFRIYSALYALGTFSTVFSHSSGDNEMVYQIHKRLTPYVCTETYCSKIYQKSTCNRAKAMWRGILNRKAHTQLRQISRP